MEKNNQLRKIAFFPPFIVLAAFVLLSIISHEHFLAIDNDEALLRINQDNALSLVAPRRVEQDNIVRLTIEIDKFVDGLLIGMLGIANMGRLLQVIGGG